MGDLRISDVVETTRLSARYWQRRAAMGEIPGVSYVQHGQRKTYLFTAIPSLLSKQCTGHFGLVRYDIPDCHAVGLPSQFGHQCFRGLKC